jgi:hypothetical protein
MYNDPERRKYKRLRSPFMPLFHYTARFRAKQCEGQEISSPDWDIVAVKNLSAGGMVYDYNKKLKLDSLLNLEIDFFKSTPSINCVGRVVRIEKSQANSMFSIAAKFTEIGEEEKEMINTNVENILRKEAREKNCNLEKPEKIKDMATRERTIAESRQKNSTTLQMKNITEKTVENKSLPEKATRSIGIKKEFLKTKNVCRVTFSFPKEATYDAERVSIVGDFNNWDIHANPMKKQKNEDYIISLDLEQGREYQFRYLIDESKWENDWRADKYVRNPYGDGDNSVVVIDGLN